MNATQAAIRAGYSEDSAGVIGCENLTKPHIQEAIAAQKQLLADKAELSIAKILDTLKNIQGRCLQSAPVYDRTGKRVIIENQSTGEEDCAAYTFDSKGAIKATELLGKHLGMFKEGHSMQFIGADGKPMGEGGTLRIEIVGVEPRIAVEPKPVEVTEMPAETQNT